VRTSTLVILAAACCLAFLGTSHLALAVEESPAVSATDTAKADDPILATVNGDPVRQSDVAKLYEQYKSVGRLGKEERDAATFFASGDAQQREMLIEEAIYRERIRQFVLSSPIKVDAATIDAELEKWAKQLAEQDMTPEQFYKDHFITKEEFREIILIDLGIRKIAESELTKEELGSLKEQVRASHILIKSSEDIGDEEAKQKGLLTDEQAKEKIVLIKKEIEGGRAFEECAKAYSECPSSEKGGDLGFFPRHGAMVEPFAETAYLLKEGEISGPVKTRFGYHLIMVTGRKEMTEEEKLRTKNRLMQGKYRALMEEAQETIKVERLYKPEEDKETEPAKGEEESAEAPE